MKSTRRSYFLLLILLLHFAWLHAENSFYLKEGDRVVFYGDSITDQRLYTGFVESYVLTRFPQLNVSFVHSGWGGDRVTGGGGGKIDERLRRDVIAYKPTVVTIMLGMNDGGYKAFDPELFNTFANGYRHIIQTLKEGLPGVRITVIQPSPYDDVTRPAAFEGGYNAVLFRYGNFIKQLAQEEGLQVADLNTPVVAALERAKATDPALAQRIVPDRVHPGPGGHLVMAAALLKAWNAPAMVSSVQIGTVQGRVAGKEAVNAEVSDLSPGNALSWTQTDKALPMPYDMTDSPLALAVRSSDVVESVNRQPLTVKDLTVTRYTLKIDGEEVGIFTKEQLAAGINLARLATPMSKQAMAVHALTGKHNLIHFARWRQVQVPLQNDSSAYMQKAVEALDTLEADLIRQQRAAAQPKPHKFELVPQ
ncbi:MAG TPA: SGNH/GDSL hydrolase family protein [Acidobacteriota bacterium]|jgi:lysophospholipase L1-like esterase